MRIVLLILAPLIVLAIALTGTHILVERLFILMVLVILASYVVARLSLRGLKGRLDNPGQHHLPGQPIQVEASVENHSRWPRPFLNVMVKTTRRSKKTPLDLPTGGVYNWHGQASYERRGRYRVGPLVVESSDPLGIMRLSRTLDKGKDVIICPATHELPFFQAESGPLRNKLVSQEAGAFSGIREYVPGDSFNRIHWRSTAHTGKLIVKEFDIDRSERIWIVPDLNRDFNAGRGAESTGEYIISIAASLVKKYSDAGRPVGLMAQNDSYHYHPAHSGYLNMWRIMEDLALMQTDGRVPLPRIIFRTREHLTGNSMLILITASNHPEIADSIISAGKQGVRTVAVLVDGSTFGGGASPLKIRNRLASSDIPAYLVRQGKNLSEELDSRKLSLAAGTVTHDFAA